MSNSNDEEMAALEPILDELETASYNSIIRVAEYLVNYYEPKLDSSYLAVNQIIITLCNVTGELLAAIPEEDRDDIEAKIHDLITYRRTMTETEIAMEDNEPQPETSMDLATMTPLGNC